MAEAGIIDWLVIKELEADLGLGGVQKLLRTFVTNADERLTRLKTILDQDNAAEAAKEAHSLKGVASTLGIRCVARAAEAFEEAAQQGRHAEFASLVEGTIANINLARSVLLATYPHLLELPH